MSTPVLTPTSYLVLGCLASAGPSTPYELKQAVNAGVGFFWSFPHSQLYSEPVRLAEAGLLHEEREESGRRRRVFSLTDAGHAALRQWLATPTSELPEIRDIALLKLFFGAHAEPGQIAGLAAQQREAHRARLALYEALSQPADPSPAAATLGLGLSFERAAIAFWTTILNDPPTG